MPTPLENSDEANRALLAWATESAGTTSLLLRSPEVKKAEDLQALLEQTARGHGFATFADMERRLVEEGEELEKAESEELVKRLARSKQHIDEYLSKPALPTVDLTGLVALSDMNRTVARIIRVVLLGYTHDELEELSGRMQAERAEQVNGGLASAEVQHEQTLQLLETAGRSLRSGKLT